MGADEGVLAQEVRQDAAGYKIGYLPGRSGRLVVSFSGVGRGRKTTPPFEFVGTASNDGENHVLMVSDRTRSWMNNAALTDAVLTEIDGIRARAGIREVVTLGNSMGGFMALVLPQLTAVDCVIAMSPQYSLHPERVPEETRWQFWRDRFPEYRHETVEPLDPEAQNIFVFHGDTAEETIHWKRFPKSDAMHHFIVRGGAHTLALDFKRQRILRKLFRNAVAGRPRRVRQLLEGSFEAFRREEYPETSV